MRKIGMTTSIPVEAVFAAGCIPVDLNNVFITAPDPAALVAQAEHDGFPRSACGWIKGIYSAARQYSILNTQYAMPLDAIIAVVEGDCSQTQAMVETLEDQGMEVIPFSYPYGRDRDMLRLQIDKLIDRLGATWDGALDWKRRLDTIRRKVARIDELTWQTGSASSYENHYYQVNCSDFLGNPDAFDREVDDFLSLPSEGRVGEGSESGRAGEWSESANSLPAAGRVGVGSESANPLPSEGRVGEGSLRLGYIGVPPIFTDFYDFIESLTRVSSSTRSSASSPCPSIRTTWSSNTRSTPTPTTSSPASPTSSAKSTAARLPASSTTPRASASARSRT